MHRARINRSVHQTDSAASYALARMAARRTVRAAMALTSLRNGIAAAREAWLAPTAVDMPTTIDPWLPYPELRIAHTGDGGLAAMSAPLVALQREDRRARLTQVRPDLLLIDGPGELAGDELRDLVKHARQLDLPIVATGAGVEFVEQAGVTRAVTALLPTTGSSVANLPRSILRQELDPWVDTRWANPIGLDHAPKGHWCLEPALSASEQVAMARQHAVVTAPLVGGDEAPHAQQVLRLLAAGVPVVAERTALLERLLSPRIDLLGAVGELSMLADELIADPGLRERASVRLRRQVLAERSSTQAFERVLEVIGLQRRHPPTISVLLATRRPEFLAQALVAVDRQSHPNLDIQLILHGIDPQIPERAISAHRRLQIHHVSVDQPLGTALNVGLDAAGGQLIAKMDDDDLYGPGHLSDLLVALSYSGADAVGRWSNVVYLKDRDVTVHQNAERQERWAHHLPGCTLLVRGEVMRSLRWRRVPRGVDTELVRAIYGAGGWCYSTHRFGFVRQRHGDHTFSRDERSFLREGWSTPGLDRSVLEV